MLNEKSQSRRRRPVAYQSKLRRELSHRKSRNSKATRDECGKHRKYSQRSLSNALRLCLRLVIAGLLLFAAGVAVIYFLQWRNSQSVFSTLRAFTHNEVVNNNLQDIVFPVKNLNVYADVACIANAATANSLRNELNAQLAKTPPHIAKEIIASAVINGMSTTNSRQNTLEDPNQSNIAHSYIAFWVTVYNKGAHLYSKYSSCVLSAGFSVFASEELAGFQITTDRILNGTEPCNCGRILCATCPVFAKVENRIPVFKRYKMTLKEQIILHRWLIKRAVNQASALLSEHDTIGGAWLTRTVAQRELDAISWRSPNQDVFRGIDSKNARDAFIWRGVF